MTILGGVANHVKILKYWIHHGDLARIFFFRTLINIICYENSIDGFIKNNKKETFKW